MADSLLDDNLRIYNISCSLEKKLVKLYVTDQGIGRQDGNRVAIISTHRNLQDVLDQNRLRDLGDLPVLKTCNINEIEYLPLINHNRKFVIVGLNYRAHCEEIGRPVPTNLIFGEVPGTASHSCDGDVIIPKSAPNEIDYEGAIGIVIGRHASNTPEDHAHEVIAGLVAINDVSARDVQAVGNPLEAVAKAKGFETFKPHGPCLATLDEFPDPLDIGITTTVNGELRQEGRTSDMVFSFPQIISIVSQKVDLRAGDLICTGTPGGVAHGGKYPFLKHGDEVVVRVEGLPPLTNTFICEK